MNIRDIMRIAPVIPVLIIDKLEHAAPLAQALYAGGLKVLEVTLRTPVALQAISAMRQAAPDAVVGAGTLTKPEDFTAVAQAGAQFAVSPGLTLDLVEAHQGMSYPLLPGVMTPAEVIFARQHGYTSLKLFPAMQAGGIGMLKALASPFSDVRFCPTGGITRETAPDFLALKNVLCVGGSWVAPTQLMDSGDWTGIEALAREASQLQRAALIP